MLETPITAATLVRATPGHIGFGLAGHVGHAPRGPSISERRRTQQHGPTAAVTQSELTRDVPGFPALPRAHSASKRAAVAEALVRATPLDVAAGRARHVGFEDHRGGREEDSDTLGALSLGRYGAATTPTERHRTGDKRDARAEALVGADGVGARLAGPVGLEIGVAEEDRARVCDLGLKRHFTRRAARHDSYTRGERTASGGINGLHLVRTAAAAGSAGIVVQGWRCRYGSRGSAGGEVACHGDVCAEEQGRHV